MALAQQGGGTTQVNVDGLDSQGITHAYSRPPRDTKIFLKKSKDKSTDASGKITKMSLKMSPIGQKKANFSSGNRPGQEVWNGPLGGMTWTLKCPVRGSVDGVIRKPII